VSVIDMGMRRRVLESDARVERLEKLLATWVAYCDQAGEGREFDELNPVHLLLRETRNALQERTQRRRM